MTLVNRVSLFFLVALAICLAGYSLLSYLLISRYLYHQFDQQLQSALNALVAAVEVEDDGVKWQPTEHTIAFGGGPDSDEVRWILVDQRARVVDRSRNLKPTAPDETMLLDVSKSEASETSETNATGSWRLLRKPLAASAPKPETEMEPDEFAAVVVVVARNSDELNTDLSRLIALAWALPIGVWTLAAVVGRRYCQRALAPLVAMSRRAQSMTQADFRLRLPIASHRDELADLAAAFNGLLDQLQQAFEKQKRFTGDAAHQLRTPLTVLRGELDVALRRPRSESEYREVLGTLQQQVHELQQIVEALLFLARSESEAPPPEAEEIDLVEWLPQYMQRWQKHSRAADLSHTASAPAVVFASRQLLAQALDNLIGNALKYSPQGSPVTIRATDSAGQVDITVEDKGTGIADDERTAIFEPFYRSPKARQSGIEGTGLGLTLVAGIAKAFDGSVACESRSPRGSRFTLCLPSSKTSHPEK